MPASGGQWSSITMRDHSPPPVTSIDDLPPPPPPVLGRSSVPSWPPVGRLRVADAAGNQLTASSGGGLGGGGETPTARDLCWWNLERLDGRRLEFSCCYLRCWGKEGSNGRRRGLTELQREQYINLPNRWDFPRPQAHEAASRPLHVQWAPMRPTGWWIVCTCRVFTGLHRKGLTSAARSAGPVSQAWLSWEIWWWSVLLQRASSVRNIYRDFVVKCWQISVNIMHQSVTYKRFQHLRANDVSWRQQWSY